MKISALVLQADAVGGMERSSARGMWPQMTTGRVFSARVLAVDSGGLFSLDIDGRTIVARSGLPLTVGEELLLKVKDPGPPPVLLPVPVETRSTSILFSRLLALLDRNNVDEFAAVLSPLHFESGEIPFPLFSDRSELSSLLRLVAALLPRMTGHAGHHRESVGEDRSAPSRTTDRGEIINLMQQFNNTSMAGRDICYGFPFLYENDNGYGAWFFSREQSSTAGQPESVAEFFLLLSSLGEVRARVGIGPTGVRGDIWLGSEPARQHLRRELAGLKERLFLITGQGVDVRVRSEPPVLRAELARVLGSGGGNGLLDTRV